MAKLEAVSRQKFSPITSEYIKLDTTSDGELSIITKFSYIWQSNLAFPHSVCNSTLFIEFNSSNVINILYKKKRKKRKEGRNIWKSGITRKPKSVQKKFPRLWLKAIREGYQPIRNPQILNTHLPTCHVSQLPPLPSLHFLFFSLIYL